MNLPSTLALAAALAGAAVTGGAFPEIEAQAGERPPKAVTPLAFVSTAATTPVSMHAPDSAARRTPPAS